MTTPTRNGVNGVNGVKLMIDLLVVKWVDELRERDNRNKMVLPNVRGSEWVEMSCSSK